MFWIEFLCERRETPLRSGLAENHHFHTCALGVHAKVNVPNNKKRKLGPRIVDCVFLGYSLCKIAYRFLVVKSEVPDVYVDTTMESCDATFFEHIFPMKDIHSNSTYSSKITPTHDTPSEIFEQPHEIVLEEDGNDAPRNSKRQRVENPLVMISLCTLWTTLVLPLQKHFHLMMQMIGKKQFRMRWTQFFRMVCGRSLINPMAVNMWVVSGCLKRSSSLMVQLRSTRLGLWLKSILKKEGEDFINTYSTIARMTTIPVLLSLAASYGLLVHQIDVKTTFLNGELDEEIYMEQPDGFVVKGQGLKQAPKQWHEKFDTTLTSADFAINEADMCVYYHYGGGKWVILCLYVDDILIFGTNIYVIIEVKFFLSKSFDMKDLGEVDVILNIKPIKTNGVITLS
jgi:hypothetical protein